MREIIRKTPKIVIERNRDIYLRTRNIRDIFGVLAASNVVMAASDDVLSASNDVLEASDGKNANL